MQGFRTYRRRFVTQVGGSILWNIERAVVKQSRVADRPFLETSDIPQLAALEENWKVIRSELDGVLSELSDIPSFQDISPDQKSISSDDGWKTYFLIGMGYRAEGNCVRCPETTRLVTAVPGMTTAFFSILAPHKHIPAHRGLYKGLLRYHLGLLVPEPREQCRIRVHEEVRHWEEGKGMLFDDTFDHEVWNDTDGYRAVLFMDIKRPLKQPSSALNDVILGLVKRTGYVQDARKNQAMWDARRQQLHD
jgi:ornithine lipid ester-linked acyl 2-hydroxylase